MQTQKTVLDSFNDSIQGNIVGGTAYEIYSISTIQNTDSLIVVINTNFPTDGIGNTRADDGKIESGDLLLNFSDSSLDAANGNLYGIRFVDNNESGVPQIGLYRNVTAVSVAAQNSLGLPNYGAYNSYVVDGHGTPTAGDLGANDPYFNVNTHVPNVIQSGTFVTGIRQLNSDTLNAMGITTPGSGSNTIAIEIPRSLLPSGNFTASWSPSCNNDVVAIRDTNVMHPGIAIEKYLNCKDADTPGEHVDVRAGSLVHFRYQVTNTGDVSFTKDQVQVTDDDLNFVPVLDAESDVGNDGILSPGEVWIYKAEGRLQTPSVSRLDFDTDGQGNPLAAGTLIDDEFKSLGITVSTPNPRDFDAMIFDSSHPTGGDFDLGTANRAFGGPGRGRGGRHGHPGENRQDLGNVLIISEDGNSSNPDDDASGGKIRFEFDELVGVSGVGLLDIEKCGGSIRTFDAEGDLIRSYNIRALGDNSFQTVKLRNELVSAIEITLRDGGAITQLDYTPLYRNTGTVNVGLANGSLSASDKAYAEILPPRPCCSCGC